MKRLIAVALTVLIGAGWSGPCFAWGDEGHEIVALLAARLLEPGVRRQVEAMLRADPDTLTPPKISAAATWADKYRESNIDDARQRTREWHFVDIELSDPDLTKACFGRPALPPGTPASQGPAKGCVVDKIEQFAAELADPRTEVQERTRALKFVLHLVGDLHQPLHASDDHDRGGNDKRASSDEFRAGTLHHYWDTEFVEALGTNPHRVAGALLRRMTPVQKADWARGTPEDWAMESFQIAKADVYGQLPPPNERGGYRLPDSYAAMAERDVTLQLSRAGVRLATVLNKALGQGR